MFMDFLVRAVVVEFSVLNPNVNMVVASRLLFEFGTDAGVGVKQEHTSINVRKGHGSYHIPG